MNWHFIVQFLDTSNNVIYTKDIIDTRNSWKSGLKEQLTRIEREVPAEWKKVTISVEKE